MARRIRHAVPATMNERGGAHRSAGGRKVSTDWAVPYRGLHDAISMSRGMASDAGTVSAEHGIGKLKRRWLSLQMTPLQLGMMRAMKHELDPRGILAPGNIF